MITVIITCIINRKLQLPHIHDLFTICHSDLEQFKGNDFHFPIFSKELVHHTYKEQILMVLISSFKQILLYLVLCCRGNVLEQVQLSLLRAPRTTRKVHMGPNADSMKEKPMLELLGGLHSPR